MKVGKKREGHLQLRTRTKRCCPSSGVTPAHEPPTHVTAAATCLQLLH